MDQDQYSSDEEAVTPFVLITEHPKSHGYRFRYGCEGKTAGSIPGAKSTEKNKTAPAIKLQNVPSGSNALVVVSCVTAEEPYRPHPHKLVGTNCDKGVCTVSLKRTNNHVFQHLGVQCIKKKEIPQSLKLREQIKVNPFCTDYYDPEYNYDMKRVRLAMQAFITDGQGSLIPLEPIISNTIHDQKNESELAICRMDRHYCQAKGGQEVFLLTEKVSKDDIQVNVYEEDDTGQMIWEDWGEFSPNDVHKQYAIVFKMPPYKDLSLAQPKEVKIRLYRPSDESFSESKSFTYKPNDVDPHGVNSKRKRRNDGTGIAVTPNIPQLAAFSSTQIKPDILKMLSKENVSKPSATVTNATQNIGIIPKEEPFYTSLNSPFMPQCSPNQVQTSYGSATAQTSNGLSATGIQYPIPKGESDGPPLPNMDQLMEISQASPIVAQTSSPIPAVVDQLSAPPVMHPMQIPSTIDTSGRGHVIAQPTDQAELQISHQTGDQMQELFNSLVQDIAGNQNLGDYGLGEYFTANETENIDLGFGFDFDPAMLQTDDGGVVNKKPKTKRKTKKK